jgi:TDG/mug DNA glycosylase family protein
MGPRTHGVRIHGFPAVVADDARILILGSMPGITSLAERQYYAHPRNQFWRILEKLCEIATPQPYDARVQMLRDHHLALWDVLHSCVRPGSLDAAIEHRTAKPNDLMGLLRAAPSIERICCNGATAYSSLQRAFGNALRQQLPQIQVQPLPSTSPANASWSYARKLNAWRRALQPALDIPGGS